MKDNEGANARLRFADMVESITNLKKNPPNRVALVVPVHDQAKLFARFLEKIAQQSHQPDLIVVDDGTEDIEELLKRKGSEALYVRLRSVYGSSGGYYAGMHFGMSRSYEIIVLADSDAIPIDNNILAGEIKALDENYDYAVPMNLLYEAVDRDYSMCRRTKLASAQFLAVKRDLLLKAGLYDPCFYIGVGDFEFSSRLAKQGRFGVTDGRYLH